MFEFNFDLYIYVLLTSMALLVVVPLFYLELKLCDKTDPMHFPKVVMSIGRSFLINLAFLIIVLTLIPLFFYFMGAPSRKLYTEFSIGDKLLVLIIASVIGLWVRATDAQQKVKMNKLERISHK